MGIGAAVTEALYHLLFDNNGGEHTDVQTILSRMANLTYRAKKGSIYRGKRTHGAVVTWEDISPSIVNILDMETAENASRELDFLFNSAAIFALNRDKRVLDSNAQALADMLKGFAAEVSRISRQ